MCDTGDTVPTDLRSYRWVCGYRRHWWSKVCEYELIAVVGAIGYVTRRQLETIVLAEAAHSGRHAWKVAR
jgi:hypothetical protein